MNKLLIKIADMLNGNAKRRRTIKQRLTVAMMQTEHHSTTALLRPGLCSCAPLDLPSTARSLTGERSFTATRFDGGSHER